MIAPRVVLLLALAGVAAVAGGQLGEYPTYHLRPASNWVGAPCAPVFDGSTGVHHVWMQYNPFGSTSGNLSWFHAVSRDLVRFGLVGITLRNNASLDAGGVGPGSAVIASSVDGRVLLTYECIDADGHARLCEAVPHSDADAMVLDRWTTRPQPALAGNVGGAPSTPMVVAPATAGGPQRWAVVTPDRAEPTQLLAYPTASIANANYTASAEFFTLANGPASTSGVSLTLPDLSVVLSPSPPRTMLKTTLPELQRDMLIVGEVPDHLDQPQFLPGCKPNVRICESNPGPASIHAVWADYGGWTSSRSSHDGNHVLWYGSIPEEDGAPNRSWAGALGIPRVGMYNASSGEYRMAPVPGFTALRQEIIGADEVEEMFENRVELVTIPSATSTEFSNGVATETNVVLRFPKTLFDEGASPTMTHAGAGVEVLVDASGHHTFVGVVYEPRNVTRGIRRTHGGYASLRNVTESTCEQTCKDDHRCIHWQVESRAGVCELFGTPNDHHMQWWTPDSDSTYGSGGFPLFGVHRHRSGTQGSSTSQVGRATLSEALLEPSSYEMHLQIFIDGSIVEAFKDHGLERVATRVYNSNATAAVAVACHQHLAGHTNATVVATVSSFSVYRLGSIEVSVAEAAYPLHHPPNGTVAVLVAAAVVAVWLVVGGFFAVRKLHFEASLRKKEPTMVNEYQAAP